MKNKFTTENAAVPLIDHQHGAIKLAVKIARDEIVSNTRVGGRRWKIINHLKNLH